MITAGALWGAWIYWCWCVAQCHWDLWATQFLWEEADNPPASWVGPGGRKRCTWQEKIDITKINCFHLFSSWEPVYVTCQRQRDSLCACWERNLFFFVTAASQMKRIMPHVTSCVCSWKFLFCSIWPLGLPISALLIYMKSLLKVQAYGVG